MNMWKQAFILNKSPVPWAKAISAGLCAGLPVLAGWLLGNIQYGLIAGIGGFTYLYTLHVPYAHRAKKLFLAWIGMSVSVGLGTWLAPHPLASALTVGLIGAAAVFVFGAFRIAGPSAIFFVLGYLMSSGMPVDPALAPLRAGLVMLGGAFSWLMGMVGGLIHPHGPETAAVSKAYRMLASYIASIGTERAGENRQKLMAALRAAEDTLLSGSIPWFVSDRYKRLVLLNDQANTLLLEILEMNHSHRRVFPPELAESARSIALLLEKKPAANPRPAWLDECDEAMRRLYGHMDRAHAILNEPLSKISIEPWMDKPSALTRLAGAFDKSSVVLYSAVRYGFVLTIAFVVADLLGYNHSYWVALSCAAVMSGATIVATLHRSIQRSIGTVIGVFLATLLLSAKPEGVVLVAAIMLFTALTEFAIVYNYGIAALFITANALIMAESTTPAYSLHFFAAARVTDVLLGSLVGLAGALLIGARQASRLLPRHMAKTIRSEQQLLVWLFSKHANRSAFNSRQDLIERRKLRTNLTNLSIVYQTALGEIPSNKQQLDSLWPAIFSIEQLAYLLFSCMKRNDRPVLPDESLAQLLLVFEWLAKAAERGEALGRKPVPEIIGFSNLTGEIRQLQEAMLVSGNSRSSDRGEN